MEVKKIFFILCIPPLTFIKNPNSERAIEKMEKNKELKEAKEHTIRVYIHRVG